MCGREEAGSDLDILTLGPQSYQGNEHPTLPGVLPRLLLGGMWCGTTGLALMQASSLYVCELLCVGMQAHVPIPAETRN